MAMKFSRVEDLMAAVKGAVAKKLDGYLSLNGKSIVVEMDKKAQMLEYGTRNMEPKAFIRKAKAAKGRSWAEAVLQRGVDKAAAEIAEDIKESMKQNGIGEESEIYKSVSWKVKG